MSLPIIILGAGGHAKVLIEGLLTSSAVIKGAIDSNPMLAGMAVHGIPILGDDDEVLKYPKDTVLLVNVLGSVASPNGRRELFKKFKSKGYNFATVIHPSTVVSSYVIMGEGSQVMAGVVIQPGCRIGNNSIINTKASIDHDCQIGDHVHIAPGATLSGGVSVGNGSHIGAGVTIIQEVKIGQHCIVGAGSVVVKDVPDGKTVYGVPAKVVI